MITGVSGFSLIPEILLRGEMWSGLKPFFFRPDSIPPSFNPTRRLVQHSPDYHNGSGIPALIGTPKIVSQIPTLTETKLMVGLKMAEFPWLLSCFL
jgi:hypothetical protein